LAWFLDSLRADLARHLLTGVEKNQKKITISLYRLPRIDYIKSTTKDNAHRPSARLGEGSKIKESGLASA
jgi:hypothetical protein